MANPQAENGHVDIANEIMDHLAKTRVPGEARQVLDFIIRKTYGWHKKVDRISLSQLAEGTGLSKPHVCMAVQKLVMMNLITKKGKDGVTEKGNDFVIYGFQKDFEKWRPLPKKGTLPKKIMPVTEKGNRPLPIKGHTKETITKETNTKENKSYGEARRFLDFFIERFKFHMRMDPLISWGKDGEIVKRILAVVPLQELQEIAEMFFTSDDPFIRKSGYTIGAFKSQVQKLRIGPASRDGMTLWLGVKEAQDERHGQRAICHADEAAQGDVSQSAFEQGRGSPAG
jgi:phage replication O-like protein O